MKENKKWCVYMHTCPNDKKYIGLTQNIKDRWNGCGLNYEKSTNFFYAIRKYGWDNIKHEVLVDSLSYEEAQKLEKKYIEQYDTTNPVKGYNMTTGGSICKKTAKRRVVQYDNDGNILNVYLHQIDASKKTGISQGVISKICLHKQRTTKEGYVFRYEGDPFNINNCDITPLRIPIYQLDKEKNIINSYLCVADAARKIGCDWSSINSALDKENRKCCEYYWCTQDNFDNFNPSEINKSRRNYCRVSQYDLDGNYITTYKSMREAGDTIGIGHCNISLVCKGEREQAGGFIWRYADEVENNIVESIPKSY